MCAESHVVLVGLSHKTASVSQRERLAFGEETIADALKQIAALEACDEAVVLSTCNRVELYAAGKAEASEMGDALIEFVSTFQKVETDEFAEAVYRKEGWEAVEHLFEVSSSIDSQIMGETEILGQTRDAYRLASEAEVAGPIMRGVFERAFHLAKELRADGGIGKARASVSSAAVQLAQNFFEELARRRVLVVGTGEMAAGMVRSLKSAGCKDVLVCSRTQARAEAFADEEGGKACRMEDLVEHVGKSDIVLVSTAAPHYIIRLEQVREARRARYGRPIFFVDISVPRNVDPKIQDLEDVYLFDIDDLESVASEGRKLREEVAARWRPRLAEEARRIVNQVRSEAPDDAAKLLMERANALREVELAALQNGEEIDAATAEKVAAALTRFQSKLLHGPLAALKRATRDGEGDEAAKWITEMFKTSPRASGSQPAVEKKDSD